MTKAYRVTFYRKVNNSYGRDFEVTVGTIDAQADNSDECVDKAKRQFEQQAHLYSWRHVADGYRVE